MLELQVEITKIRSGANLETKWKHRVFFFILFCFYH